MHVRLHLFDFLSIINFINCTGSTEKREEKAALVGNTDLYCSKAVVLLSVHAVILPFKLKTYSLS